MGLNEPGSAFDSPCRVVRIAETTAKIGRKYFVSERALERGVTIGLARLRAARHVVFIASGPTKVDSLAKAVEEAYESRSRLIGSHAIVGFDGFVDVLARVVKSREVDGRELFYESTREFGEALAAAGGSRSLELVRTAFKAGGNMPIFASSLGSSGLHVFCVGALGYPLRHPAFDDWPISCEPLCFADPGQTTALEFSDGKIMFAEMGGLHRATWEIVKERVGLDTLCSIASNAALVGFCNWSGIDASDGIWRGMLSEVLVAPPAQGRRFLLFDLADCSKRSTESIRAVTSLIMDRRRWLCRPSSSIRSCRRSLGPKGFWKSYGPSMRPISGVASRIRAGRMLGVRAIEIECM